jgi:hypothetical protein
MSVTTTQPVAFLLSEQAALSRACGALVPASQSALLAYRGSVAGGHRGTTPDQRPVCPIGPLAPAGLLFAVAADMLGGVSLHEHPGYLGYTSQGVVAIHGDWPMYPAEHDWLTALASLGSFPAGTTFSRLDDIDRCVLLLADNLSEDRDPFSQRNFHVALWHADFLELANRGYVQGPIAVTERVHQLNDLMEIAKEHIERLGRQGVDIERLTVRAHPPVTSWPAGGPPELPRFSARIPGEETSLSFDPQWELYDDEDTDWICFPEAATANVTDTGWEALDDTSPAISSRPRRCAADLIPSLPPVSTTRRSGRCRWLWRL